MSQAKPINDRHNTTPDTLVDLQESLYDWQKYNFGDQDNDRILLGICEEIGELCHAQLKGEQGIRGTAEEHNAAMKDAVGDIMIYLLNYLSHLDGKLVAFAPRDDVAKAENQKQIRDSVISLVRLVGDLTTDRENEQKISQVVYNLNYLCALKEWSLDAVIRETWGQVSQRDWKEYPETGRPPVQVAG